MIYKRSCERSWLYVVHSYWSFIVHCFLLCSRQILYMGPDRTWKHRRSRFSRTFCAANKMRMPVWTSSFWLLCAWGLALHLICELLALVSNIQYLFNSKLDKIVEISSFMRFFLFAVYRLKSKAWPKSRWVTRNPHANFPYFFVI